MAPFVKAAGCDATRIRRNNCATVMTAVVVVMGMVVEVVGSIRAVPVLVVLAVPESLFFL